MAMRGTGLAERADVVARGVPDASPRDEAAIERVKRRLASEAAEKESCRTAHVRIRRAVDHHCKLLTDTCERISAAQRGVAAEDSNDALVHQVQEIARALDNEIQEALAIERSGVAVAPSVGSPLLGMGSSGQGLDGQVSGNYGILKRSLQETQRRCEDLNHDLTRQTGAKEELVQTLETVKDTNRRLLEQLKTVNDEHTRLKKQCAADEERIESCQRNHRADEDSFDRESRQRLLAVQEASNTRLGAMERSLAERVRSAAARLVAVQDGFVALGRQCREMNTHAQFNNFRQGLQAAEDSIAARVAAYAQQQASQRAEKESSAMDLGDRIECEVDARQSEAEKRSQQQAILAVERDQLQARSSREVSHLSARVQALCQSLRAERGLLAEDRHRVTQLRERLCVERDDCNAALDDVKREIVRLESVSSASAVESRMRDQSTVELRRQVRESDDALAAAVSGNEHLRQQLDEHQQRSQEVCEVELSTVRLASEQRLAQARTFHDGCMAKSTEQFRSLEDMVFAQKEDAIQLKSQIETLTSESQTLVNDIATWKLNYEAANCSRQVLEQEQAEARKDFARERLRLQASIDQLGPQNVALETEARTVAEQFTEYKRLSTDQSTKLVSKIGALDDLVRDAQIQLVDARSRLAEATDAVERTAADLAEMQQRATEQQHELEEELRRRRHELTDTKRSLEEQLSNEQRSAQQHVEEAEHRRETQATSLRHRHEEYSAQVLALEHTRSQAEEQQRFVEEEAQKLLAEQDYRKHTLGNDLGRIRALVAESQANIAWIHEEKDKETREANALRERLEDDLRTASSSLAAIVKDEASTKASLNGATVRQREESQRLSQEITQLRQKMAVHQAQASERLKQLQNECDGHVRASETKMRDSISTNRVKLEALARENEQLRLFLAGQPQDAKTSASAAVAETGIVNFAAASRPHSQLESHLQRLQRHTEELRSDLAKNAATNPALPQSTQASALGRTAEFGP